MTSSAPTLETARLILRHYRKEDFRPWHAIVGDPEVMRHFGGKGMVIVVRLFGRYSTKAVP